MRLERLHPRLQFDRLESVHAAEDLTHPPNNLGRSFRGGTLEVSQVLIAHTGSLVLFHSLLNAMIALMAEASSLFSFLLSFLMPLRRRQMFHLTVVGFCPVRFAILLIIFVL